MKVIKSLIENLRLVFNLETLKDIFKHPEAHARELPIILSILSLLTLAVIVYYYIAVVRKIKESEPYEVLLRKNGIYFAVAFALTIVFLYVPFLYISSSRSCLNCHSKTGMHSSSLEEVHKEVECESCHIKPGFTGRFEGFFKLTSKIINYNLLQQRNFSNTCCVSAQSCLSCHSNVLQSTVDSHFTKVSHREIFEKNRDCTGCHSFKRDKPVSPMLVMEKCGECHNGITAATKCDLCHVPFGKPSNILPDLKDYPKVTEKGPPPVIEGVEPSPSVNVVNP